VALTVGELNGYLRLDDTNFRRTVLQSAARIVSLRQIVEAQASAIDRAFSDIRANVTVDIDTAHVHAALDEVERRADRVGRLDPTITAHANVGVALAQIDRLERASRRVGDDQSPTRAASRFASLAGSIGGLVGPIGSVAGQAGLIAGALGAAIPVAAGLVAALVDIAPAAAVGATAVLAIASAVGAVKLGLGGVGSAFKAAFAPAVSGGGAAGNTARQVADAQRALKDATEQAGYANAQAAEQTARAERQVVDAQRQARQAQDDLNASREQATRDLQDMNESLADAYVDQEQAVLDLSTAQKKLDADRLAGADEDTIRQDEINLERAQRQLEEQDIATKRLQADTDKANEAGVDGSQTMIQARQQVADANQNLSDQEQALADARTQQARTAAQGLENIQKAVEALDAANQKAGGGAAKLASALDKLSPNARAFVLQVIALRGAWTALQQDVQNRLFENLASTLKSTATQVLPVLRTGLVGTAGDLNLMALGVMTAAAQLASNGTFGRAMASANTGLHNLAGIPGQVVTALFQLGVAAGPAFDRLTAAAARGATSISERLDAAFKDGRLQAAIDQAVALIHQMGVIAGNVGHILGSIFGAANQSGAGFLNTLTVVTGALAKAFADPVVQAGLHSLFQTMSLVGQVAGPLLIQVLKMIAPVITALAPPVQQVVTLLGGSLSHIITALGPVLLIAAKGVGQLLVALAPLLDVVPILLPPLGDLIAALAAGLVPIAQALQPVLGAVATAIGQLLEAVAPLLPVVGQMIASLGPILTPIVQVIGHAFADLAPILADLGRRLLPPFAKIVSTAADAFLQLQPVLDTALDQLGDQGLAPIIDALVDLISQFVDQYADEFVQIFQELLPVVPLLIPVFVQFGQSLAQILEALGPLLPQIMLLTTQLIAELLPAILPLIPPLTQMEILFLRLATGVITGVVIPVISGLIKFMGGLRTALQPAVDAVEWVTKAIAAPFEWLYDHLVGHSVIPDTVNSIVRWFAGLPGRAVTALAGIATKLGGVISGATNSMIQATITGLRAVVSWFSDLPGRAKDALGNLGSYLYKSGQSLIGGFIDGITSMGSVLSNAAGSLLSNVSDFFPHSPAKKGPFSGQGWTPFRGAALALGFASGMTAQASAVSTAARALAGAASAELATPGTSMGALVTPRPSLAGGYSRRSGDGGGAQSETRHVLVLQVKGDSNDVLVQSLRESIGTRGGNVQFVLGDG
jgi:phage-related protein